MLGLPLPFYKSPTLLLGFGLSPFVLTRLWRHRPDIIHVAFPGVLPPPFPSARTPCLPACSISGHFRTCCTISDTMFAVTSQWCILK